MFRILSFTITLLFEPKRSYLSDFLLLAKKNKIIQIEVLLIITQKKKLTGYES